MGPKSIMKPGGSPTPVTQEAQRGAVSNRSAGSPTAGGGAKRVVCQPCLGGGGAAIPCVACPTAGGAVAKLGVSAGGDGDAVRKSPSQHIGYLRALMLAAGVVSAVWRPAKVLVDSGSQQPPLMSHDFARSLGCRVGGPSGTAAQADGSLIRLYDVGRVDLCVNGRPEPTAFQVADIAPYDCILGESWLTRQRGMLD